MLKYSLSLIIFFLLFTIFDTEALAIQLSISSPPSTIDQNEEFLLNVSLTSCTGSCSDSYLRGVFYPSGSSYFGYTQDNNSNWINSPGGNCTNYFKVGTSDLQSGSWSGVLKFKPDPTSSFYNGPGEYLFKLARYTPSCSGISTSSQEFTVAITGPTPTPSPTPVPTSSPTPTPKPTSTPTLSPKPSASPVKSITPSKTVLSASDSEAKQFYDFSKTPTPSKSISPILVAGEESSPNFLLPIIFIVGGGFIAAAVGWLAFDKFYKENNS